KIAPAFAQGFVPGQEYAAEFRNYLFNICGQWTNWLASGSPTGDADAHIVETDSSGNTKLQSLNLAANLNVDGVSTLGGAVDVTGVDSPATLAAQEDDWWPPGLDSGATFFRVTPAVGGSIITGIATAADGADVDPGRVNGIVNAGSTHLTLEDEGASGTSLAVNRLRLPGGTNIVMPPNACVQLWYDAAASRWLAIAQSL